jgi:DNA-binding GntR family transcriptional regulator
MIHAAILSGDLPAGSRLKVRDLAEQVGTSVMPVREAIRRLEETGLAERVPHKGAVVKSLTFEELIHVYDVRRLLETEAARLGSERITPEDCDRMQSEYELMRKAISMSARSSPCWTMTRPCWPSSTRLRAIRSSSR